MKGDRKIIYSKIYCFINLPQLPLADGAAVFSGIYLCYMNMSSEDVVFHQLMEFKRANESVAHGCTVTSVLGI